MKRFTSFKKPFKAFRCNLNNTPPPQHIDSNEELNTAFSHFAHTLSKYGKTLPLSQRLIGSCVRKSFNNIEYSGKIVSSDFESSTGKHIYRIIYHDLDSEDLYFSELKPLLCNKIPAQRITGTSTSFPFDFSSFIKTGTYDYSASPSNSTIKGLNRVVSDSVA